MKRLLFPARCPGCDDILPWAFSDGTFCDECLPEVVYNTGRICHCCGKPIPPGHSDLCRDCKNESRYILQGRGAFIYTGPLKLAMYRLKYSGRKAYATYLAAESIKIYGGWIKKLSPDVIIPIPMFSDKMKKRGYNQAEVFAKALSKLISVPVRTDILKRSKNTIPQKGLDRENRRKNIKNAFKIVQSSVKFNCVLLVDDIYTTGTTVDEAARVLNEAFGARIFSFCICVGAD